MMFKFYLMRFTYGMKTHLGISNMSTRESDYGAWFRPRCECADSPLKRAFPISKELPLAEAGSHITCEKCKIIMQQYTNVLKKEEKDEKTSEIRENNEADHHD